jgi:hypothetical protein
MSPALTVTGCAFVALSAADATASRFVRDPAIVTPLLKDRIEGVVFHRRPIHSGRTSTPVRAP